MKPISPPNYILQFLKIVKSSYMGTSLQIKLNFCVRISRDINAFEIEYIFRDSDFCLDPTYICVSLCIRETQFIHTIEKS